MGTSPVLDEPVPTCQVQTAHLKVKVVLLQLLILHSCDHTTNQYRINYSPRRYGAPHRDPFWVQWRDDTEMKIFRTPMALVLLIQVTIQLKTGFIFEPDLVFPD